MELDSHRIIVGDKLNYQPPDCCQPPPPPPLAHPPDEPPCSLITLMTCTSAPWPPWPPPPCPPPPPWPPWPPPTDPPSISLIILTGAPPPEPCPCPPEPCPPPVIIIKFYSLIYCGTNKMRHCVLLWVSCSAQLSSNFPTLFQALPIERPIFFFSKSTLKRLPTSKSISKNNWCSRVYICWKFNPGTDRLARTQYKYKYK